MSGTRQGQTKKSRDRQGKSGTRQGQGRDKKGQTGTSRDSPYVSLCVPACTCLSQSFPVCPFLYLSVPVCPCLFLSVPVCPCPSLSDRICHCLSLSDHVYPFMSLALLVSPCLSQRCKHVRTCKQCLCKMFSSSGKFFAKFYGVLTQSELCHNFAIFGSIFWLNLICVKKLHF